MKVRRRGGRFRAGPWILATVVALCMLLVTPQAVAAGPAPKKPGEQVISFGLPQAGKHVFRPNVPNVAQAGRAGGPLMLFLPATRAAPSDYKEFLSTASSLGYHVLALDYHNVGLSVVRMCAGNPECYTFVQRNRFDGSVPSEFSAIDPKDSILNRLRTALRYLAASEPKGGWGRYLDGNSIRWDRIVVAGHSQGGGQSAYIAHQHHVRGALMFASPVQSDNGVPATWMATPGATPPSDMYGLVSRGDVYYRNVVDSWKAIGMGDPVESDDLAALSDGHSIVSTADLGTGADSHRRVIDDLGPREPAGKPSFAPLWSWMLQRFD